MVAGLLWAAGGCWRVLAGAGGELVRAVGRHEVFRGTSEVGELCLGESGEGAFSIGADIGRNGPTGKERASLTV